MTGFRWFSENLCILMLWTNIVLTLEGLLTIECPLGSDARSLPFLLNPSLALPIDTICYIFKDTLDWNVSTSKLCVLFIIFVSYVSFLFHFVSYCISFIILYRTVSYLQFLYHIVSNLQFFFIILYLIYNFCIILYISVFTGMYFYGHLLCKGEFFLALTDW